ncbi:hypothetical protein EOD23_20715 [Mesorhizobium sp. USDA-HM6]|nr:hypothetical protein EOD23_20715 [Mesorhizobium sp. USDA-HM6]
MRHSGKTEKHRISDVLTRTFDWLAIKVSDKRTVNGMLVVYDAGKGGRDADRVAAALQLIQDFDPIRYRRVVRDLKQIWITTIPGAVGRFVKSTSTCELDERFVLGENTVTEHIAGTIVHEATHARLEQQSISYEEKLRDRVEQVCMRRELAFATKLPDGSRIRQWVEARRKEPADHSDVALDANQIQSARAALLHLDTPRWFADMIVFLARRRHERHIRRQEAQRHFDKRN